MFFLNKCESSNNFKHFYSFLCFLVQIAFLGLKQVCVIEKMIRMIIISFLFVPATVASGCDLMDR